MGFTSTCPKGTERSQNSWAELFECSENVNDYASARLVSAGNNPERRASGSTT